MRRFLVRFIRPESFVHNPSSAGFTITTSGLEFSVHTGIPMDDERDYQRQRRNRKEGQAIFRIGDWSERTFVLFLLRKRQRQRKPRYEPREGKRRQQDQN